MSIVASLKKLIPPGGRNVHIYHGSAPANMTPLLVGAPSSVASMARAHDTKSHAAPGPRNSRSKYTLASCMQYVQVSSATSIAPVSLSTHMYNFANMWPSLRCTTLLATSSLARTPAKYTACSATTSSSNVITCDWSLKVDWC